MARGKAEQDLLMSSLGFQTQTSLKTAAEQDLVVFGPFTLSPSERRLERNGEPVELRGRSFDILLALAASPGEVVSAETLMARVWPHATVGQAALRVQMAALRRSLGAEGRRFVSTISGRGYVLNNSPVTPASGQVSWDHAPRLSLPHRGTRVIGREEVIAELVAELHQERCITLVGPAGIGKTTVAVEVARRYAAEMGATSCLVEFGSIGSPQLVTSTLLAALGLAGARTDVAQSVASFAENHPIVLILDSCEHVIEETAKLAEAIVSSVPHARVLATCREPLRAHGERVKHLPPLNMPLAGARPTTAEALAFPAIELLVDRICGQDGQFSLTQEEVPAAVTVCAMLDGMPLAIEIAACHALNLGLIEMATLLSNRLDLGWAGLRTAPQRHNTLSAAIDWSYQLLTELEREVLQRLSLLVGSFSLEAAQALAADLAEPTRIAQVVASLTAKSLISITESVEARLRLLHMTRAFATDKLIASGDLVAVAGRHADYFIARLVRQRTAPAPPARARALLGELLPNVRSALDWAFGATGDQERATLLAAEAGLVFIELSLFDECERWMQLACSQLTDATAHQARRVAILSAMAAGAMFSVGTGADSKARFEQAIKIAEQTRDYASALKLWGLFNVFLQRAGDFDGVHATARRCMELARKLDDLSALRMAQWTAGVSAMQAGDHGKARRLCESAMLPTKPGDSFAYVLGYDHRVRALVVDSHCLWLQGFPDQAREAALATLEAARSAQQPVPTCVAYLSAITVLLWSGDLDQVDALVRWVIPYAERHALAPFRTAAQGLGYVAELKRNKPQLQTILLLYEALKTLVKAKYFTLTPYLAVNLAEAQAEFGRLPEALKTVGDALAHSDPLGDNYHSDLLRLQGELLIMDPDGDSKEGEARLRAALAVARQQGDRSWELRAAMGLGRLLRDRGHEAEAKDLVQSVYREFREGFGTSDLRAASEFLAAA